MAESILGGGKFPINLLDPPTGKKWSTSSPQATKQSKGQRRGITSIVGESIKETLSDRKQAFIGGIREKVFNAGIVGSVMRKTWEKTHGQDNAGEVATKSFNAIMTIAQQATRTNATLTKIERVVTNISDNIYNIAGVLKAQLTSMRQTASDMAAQKEETDSEHTLDPNSPILMKKEDSTGGSGGFISNLLAGPMKVLSNVAGVIASIGRVIGPAALVIGAAYAGFKIGEWLNDKFKLSDKLVDGIEWIVDFFKPKKQDAPTQTPAERVERGEATSLKQAGAQGTRAAIRKFGDRLEAVDKPNVSGLAKSESGTIEDFIQGKENAPGDFKDSVYRDSSGKEHIGFGHLITDREKQSGIVIGKDLVPYTPSMKISKQQGETLFKQDVSSKTDFVKDKLGTENYNKLNNNQKAALVSYAYNTGHIPTGAKEALIKGDMQGVASSIAGGINTTGGEQSKGLTKRRKEEADLFNTADSGVKIAQATIQNDAARDQKAAQPIVITTGGASSDGLASSQKRRGIPSPVANRGSLEEGVRIPG